MAKEKQINNFQEALDFIYSTIPKGTKRFPGEVGIKRQKQLLSFLGNPQNKIKVIHIAGTSGKGSVASYLSSLLISHGFKVGTTLSPHLKDIRERIQINRELITEREFALLANEVFLAVNKINKVKLGEPTFFEILIAMAFLGFYKNRVNYAVVETGMGGLFDGTNAVESEDKIAVITRLGLDHMSILGKKITDIAFQKAGIIQNKNTVFSLWQLKGAREVLDNESLKKITKIHYVKKGVNFKNIKTNENGIEYDYSYEDLKLNLKLNNFGLYQVENSSLALSVFKFISIRDGFELNESKIKKTINEFKILGRMEIIFDNNKLLILDGAHNPQKMQSFIKSLSFGFPNKKFLFIIAFRQRKDFSRMLKMIIPLASSFIFTSFVVRDEDMVQISQPPEDMVKVLRKLNYFNYQVITNPRMALETAKGESDNIVITSSLYLLKKIYPILMEKDSVLEK